MNKPKQQGTAFESALVQHFRDENLEATRFAEGGSLDLGDLWFDDAHSYMWIVEAKATERLNVTRVLAKAREKSGIDRTVLIWKRLVKTGKKVRQADGEKVVVVMTLDMFTDLINGSAVADED